MSGKPEPSSDDERITDSKGKSVQFAREPQVIEPGAPKQGERPEKSKPSRQTSKRIERGRLYTIHHSNRKQPGSGAETSKNTPKPRDETDDEKFSDEDFMLEPTDGKKTPEDIAREEAHISRALKVLARDEWLERQDMDKETRKK